MKSGGGCSACLSHPVTVFCINCVRWVPVLFILAVIVWSYYAYVVELCLLTVEWPVEKALYLMGYHVALAMLLWSYYQTVFSDIGRPPAQFGVRGEAASALAACARPSDFRNVLDEFSRSAGLPVQMRSYDGAIRYCEKCVSVKPDRSHHCSVCGHCVLKFDHHCPWVNTCVNFRNYKFFIQFLGYALLYCAFIFLTDIKYFIWFWQVGVTEGDGGKFHIMFMFFVAGMFAISVSTLFFYHLWLSAKNRTTIESFRDPVFTYGPDKNGFNLGWRENFREVFGLRPRLWFLPIFSA